MKNADSSHPDRDDPRPGVGSDLPAGPARRIRTHYVHRIHPRRQSYDVLDWASAASQHARFKVLAERVDLSGKGLLDVGSGLGDLFAFLRARGLDAGYTGVDILPEMVREASTRHPEGDFRVADVFADPRPDDLQRDVVYCSGMFNLNLGNNLHFAPRALRRLLELAEETLVFNMLHARTPSQPGTYFYYDPQWVIAQLPDLPHRVELVDDYLVNDFTVIVEKLLAE